MFEIREKTNEQLDTLQHGMNLFHEALSGGRKAYHVTRENGDDYDIVYTRNFDYVLPAMPEAYRHLVIYWDFLTYDEEDTAHIVLDQFQNRKKVVFLETNEYTIVIGRILLRDRKDMDLYYQDPRILWFLSESEHLHVGGEVPEDTEEVLFVTAPLGNSYQNTTGNKLSVLAVFQSMFYLQAVTEKPLDKIKYIHMHFDSGLTGIGAIMSHVVRMESIFSHAGWKAYIEGDYIGKYSSRFVRSYLNLPDVPEDADDENTVSYSDMLFSRLSVTYNGLHADRIIEKKWFKDQLISEMDEYAQAVIGDKKILGVYIRGTDYITTNIYGISKQATVPEMIPMIRNWMDEYSFDGIFLATEDEGILRDMRAEFGSLVKIVAQERFSVEEFKTVKLIAELENEKYAPDEKEEHIEDMTVNYFYAMYVLSKCDSFIASGLSNGIDMVRGFNLDHFRHYYQFSVGMA